MLSENHSEVGHCKQLYSTFQRKGRGTNFFVQPTLPEDFLAMCLLIVPQWVESQSIWYTVYVVIIMLCVDSTL